MAGNLRMESGIQLLARLTKKPGTENFYPRLFEFGPRSCETIELLHDGSTSCLLIDIICGALIPHDVGVHLGVVFINTDGNCNFHLIYLFLLKKLMKYNSSNSKSIETEKIAQACMQNLLILNVYDATQLYTTIHNLESILLDHSNTSLIVFDTLTAFYWSEQGLKITKMDLYLKSVLKMINKATKEFKVTVLYTRPDYFTSNKNLEYIEPPVAVGGFEHIQYRIQLSNIPEGSFIVNVKTVDKHFCKIFSLSENSILWQ